MKIRAVVSAGYKFDPVKLEKIPIFEVTYSNGKKSIIYNPSEMKLEKLKRRISK